MPNESPRIVIGAGRPNKLAALVCEYSIRKHCPDARVIQTWHTPFIPSEKENTLHRDRWRGEPQWLPTMRPLGTMFSFCRHMVPEICGYEGEAIYLDADMIVFDDITEIWDLPMNGAKILRMCSGQFSVLKLDCEGLKEWPIKRLLSGEWNYAQLQNGRYLAPSDVAQRIPNEWNRLDQYTERTKLLHYTRMRTQPWAVPGHPFGYLWFDLLAEAVRAGFLDEQEVLHDVYEQDLERTWQAAVWPQPHVVDELNSRLKVA